MITTHSSPMDAGGRSGRGHRVVRFFMPFSNHQHSARKCGPTNPVAPVFSVTKTAKIFLNKRRPNGRFFLPSLVEPKNSYFRQLSLGARAAEIADNLESQLLQFAERRNDDRRH
jgi:hypothetical protein